MINYANYIRIFDADPSDELVEKRKSAAKDLSTKYGKVTNVGQILKNAHAICSGSLPGGPSDQIKADVESAVQKKAKAFVTDGQDLQVTVCALLTALQLLDGEFAVRPILTIVDVYALGLWSILSFSNPVNEGKLEALRQDVLTKARDHIIARSSAARRRKAVSDLSITFPDEYSSEDLASAAVPLFGAITDLRDNAAVDREEIDLLWWTLADQSSLLSRRFSSPINKVSQAIACGLEAGLQMRRVPGDAHRHLVMRNIDQNPEINLSDLLETLADDKSALAQIFSTNQTLQSCPEAFPLISAIKGTDTKPHGWEEHRALTEWASRALLESSTLQLCSHAPIVTL